MSINMFFPEPELSGISRNLGLESTLQELPLSSFQFELGGLSRELAQIFEQYSQVPGAILVEQGRFVGAISRQRFFETMMRSYAQELLWDKPMRILYSYARTEILSLPNDTSIIGAAQQALRRSANLRGEPIVVKFDNDYRLLNIHDLYIAYWQIRGVETQLRYERTQSQLIQSDKMANLGRLVDGIAHEVLDPISFIWGNLTFAQSYTDSVLRMLASYEAAFPNLPEDLCALKENLEIDYLKQDLPRAIDSIKVGAERLTKLASSLQNFCHIDDVYPKPANLHEALDGIILLLKSRVSREVQVIKSYGHLPPVPCFIGQLNQVFMNILVYSVDALLNQAVRRQLAPQFTPAGEAISAQWPTPCIEITTQVCALSDQSGHPLQPRWVSIRIFNNGPALSPEVLQRMITSFTQDRRAAKETSLATSYHIVTAKHGGKFALRSRQGVSMETNTLDPRSVGTEFEILLPLT